VSVADGNSRENLPLSQSEALKFAIRFYFVDARESANQSLHFFFAISSLSFVHFYLPKISFLKASNLLF
jgi:hypothetical protein